MPPYSPPPINTMPDVPPPKQNNSWRDMKRRATSISGILSVLVAVVLIGGAIGYFLNNSKKQAAVPKTTVQTLSEDDIKKLTEIGTSLGTSNQVLTVGANTLFRQKVDVTGDVSVGGRFNANGPVTLSQLNITGNSAVSGLNVGSNLTVAGITTLQKGLSVDGLAAINGGINVSGTASVNVLNATAISTRTISISGPLTIGHLATQGLTPTITANLGGGGTANISGNDTAGTVNVNTGSAATGVLVTITFRAGYTAGTHVLLTPLTPEAAINPVYVQRTATSFKIVAAGTVPGGKILGYDYFVTQ